MAGRRTQISVGLLVVAGAALLVGFVLFLTQDSFRRGDSIFETYFQESVQGLENGSPVRYRGVAVGRVTEIALASAQYRRPQGEAFAGAFQLVLVRFAVDLTRVGDIPLMEEAVGQGLRARLATQGITGVTYIELDFLDPERFPPRLVPWQPQYPLIPASPSTTAQVQNAAEALLRRVEALDINGLVENVNGLVSDLRGQLGDEGIGVAVREASELLKEVRDLTRRTDLPGAITELRGTATALRGVVEGREVRELLAQSSRAAADLRRAAAQLPGTLTQLDGVLRGARGATGDLQADLAPVLRDLRATTQNLRDTTEALRRNPSQTLLGAPPPPRPEGGR